MKTIRFLMAMVATLALATSAYSQTDDDYDYGYYIPPTYFSHSPAPVVGTWKAISGDFTYYVQITTRRISLGDRFKIGVIYAYRDSIIVRDTRIEDRTKSYYSGMFWDDVDTVEIWYTDHICNVDRDVFFVLSGTSATWVSEDGFEGIREVGDYDGISDMPENITFTKISNDLFEPDWLIDKTSSNYRGRGDWIPRELKFEPGGVRP